MSSACGLVVNAAQILALQRRADQSEAAIYGVRDLPPLTQSIEELEAEFGGSVVIKATVGERIVASVRACCDDGSSLIGP